MNDSASVQVINSPDNLASVFQAHVRRRRIVVGEDVVEVSATNPLHHEHGISSILARCKECNTVLMANTGSDLRLFDKIVIITFRERKPCSFESFDSNQFSIQSSLGHYTTATFFGCDLRVELQIAALDEPETDS